jgi:hypothetical protein
MPSIRDSRHGLVRGTRQKRGPRSGTFRCSADETGGHGLILDLDFQRGNYGEIGGVPLLPEFSLQDGLKVWICAQERRCRRSKGLVVTSANIIPHGPAQAAPSAHPWWSTTASPPPRGREFRAWSRDPGRASLTATGRQSEPACSRMGGDDAPHLPALPQPTGDAAFGPQPDRLPAGASAGEHPGAECRSRCRPVSLTEHPDSR